MNLEFFNRANTQNFRTPGQPTILFGAKGNIRISSAAALQIGLTAGDLIELAFDAAENQWYLTKTADAGVGFALRGINSKNDKSLQLNCMALTLKTAERFETNKQGSVPALVGAKQTFDGRDFWPLLMKRKVVRP